MEAGTNQHVAVVADFRDDGLDHTHGEHEAADTTKAQWRNARNGSG